jgi:hypothetical protein
VATTKDLDDNTRLEVDDEGNSDGMTIEHARARAKLPSLSYEPISASHLLPRTSLTAWRSAEAVSCPRDTVRVDMIWPRAPMRPLESRRCDGVWAFIAAVGLGLTLRHTVPGPFGTAT